MTGESEGDIKIQAFLLEEYRREIDAEMNRWESIENKANLTFSFSTSVSAILVGLFTLGQSMIEQQMPLGFLIPFLWFYGIGVLLFACSAVLSLLAQSVSAYKKPYLEQTQTKAREYLTMGVSQVEGILVERCVGCLESLGDNMERKVKFVKWAQNLVIIAVASVVVAMTITVSVIVGWLQVGV